MHIIPLTPYAFVSAYLVHQLGLSRRGLSLVNGYVKFQLTKHGHDPPRLPEKRRVEAAINKACARSEDGTLKEHVFEVPADTAGVKQKRIPLKV